MEGEGGGVTLNLPSPLITRLEEGGGSVRPPFHANYTLASISGKKLKITNEVYIDGLIESTTLKSVRRLEAGVYSGYFVFIQRRVLG